MTDQEMVRRAFIALGIMLSTETPAPAEMGIGLKILAETRAEFPNLAGMVLMYRLAIQIELLYGTQRNAEYIKANILPWFPLA